MDPPVTIPGGNPVKAVPGLTPRFPCTTVAPVLVTVEPARTPKLAADPRGTGNWAFRQTENAAYNANARNFLIAFSFRLGISAFGRGSSEIVHHYIWPRNKI